MVTIDRIDSLNIVKDEVIATLTAAENQLEAFTEGLEHREKLQHSVELVRQVSGVLKIIELPGAAMMTSEIQDLGAHILAHEHHNPEEWLAIMSDGLVLISRYLDYVHAKQQSLPVLLLPSINNLRRGCDKPLQAESLFFEVDTGVKRQFVRQYQAVEAPEMPALIRRLRQMYQVGLIAVIHENGDASAELKLMLRAINRIDQISGDSALGRLWWVASAVLEAMAQGYLRLNMQRKSLLGSLDRLIREVVNGGSERIQAGPDEGMVKEFVYLAALAPCNEGIIGEVRQAFGVEHYEFSDAQIAAEEELMNGPSGSVLASVTVILQEEFAQIKETLDLAARGSMRADSEGYDGALAALAKISSTLVILALPEASKVVRDVMVVIKAWEEKAPDDDAFDKVADSLLRIESSIGDFKKSNVVKRAEQSSDSVLTPTIPSSELDQARHIIISESRSGLSLTKRAISSFIDSHWDAMHLNNVPMSLRSVWGGLKFLQLDRAAEVVNQCNLFIQGRLLDVSSQDQNPYMMETLADAITSIDYYLESMENKKPIGDGVLDLAEQSVEELGYPVVAA